MNSNPYEPAGNSQVELGPYLVRRNLWAGIGFLTASVPIAAMGIFSLYSDSHYSSDLPTDTVRCGNGALAATLAVFPISPCLGIVGAGLGFLFASVRNVTVTYLFEKSRS